MSAPDEDPAPGAESGAGPGAESHPTDSREPRSAVTRTAANLLSATVITSALGVLFWAAAARWYQPAEVGLANAALSAATLSAIVAQLSLGLVFVRYLPRAGHYTGWILRRVYVVVTVVSLLFGALVTWWLSDSEYLDDGPEMALFIVGVLALALFVIQDNALLGLGRSRLVPIENGLFAVVKLGLLPLFAGITIVSGIFAAWIVTTVAAVIVVSGYIFLVAGPRHAAAAGEHVALPPRPVLWPQLIGQYAANLSSQIGLLGVPILVTAVLGPTQNGYLTIAWLIAISFSALFGNVAQSFTYHTRRGDPVTVQSFRRFAGLMLLIGVGGGAVTLLAAPVILQILAPGYQHESTSALRLIALSLPFSALWEIMWSFWWLENRMYLISGAYSLASVVLLAATWALIPHLELTAAGAALLIGMGLLGVGSVLGIRRRIALIRQGEQLRWMAVEPG